MTTTTEVHDDMAKKKAADMERYGVYITKEQKEALEQLRETGVNPAHVIREAIDAALAARGVKAKGARHGK